MQFLNNLYHHLYGLTRDQAEQHLTYYAEMLADRMEEGMTEEEAVAGMEDVETIARRIMEEEGLPYTPPDQRPAAPPSYPDVSRLGGGGGTRSYQAPKTTNWRKIAQVILWVVAIAVAIGWVGGLIEDGFGAGRNVSAPTAIDSVMEVASVEAAPYDYQEAAYIGGYEYGGGEATYAGSIDRIDIQWASGTVFIQSWNEDAVEVREYAHSELSSRTAMSLQEDGGTLTIRYRDGIGLGGVKDSKWLTVLVPDGMMEELEITTTSADVWLNELELGTLTASTASGAIMPTECYTREAELSSISGELFLSGLYADALDVSTTSGEISGNVQSEAIAVSTVSGYVSLTASGNTERAKFNTTSGDIWFSVEGPSIRSIGVSSISGDISLGLPYDMGFILEYDTVSGDFNDSSLELSKQNGKYICNNGGCEIEVDTVSGNLDIY
ncbi:MAG: DUF4097 family beta strand repeat protein [Oscillibacter sp.]|nr:DUF4097 family beta strand repeat protein [Oscillibacter sp.]